MRLLALILVTFCGTLHAATGQNERLSPSQVFQKFFGQCSQKEEVIRCLKIQALKVAERALHIKSFNVVEGLEIVANDRIGKSVSGLNFNEAKVENLTSDDLNSLLGDRTNRFLDTHRVEVNLPKLIEQTGRSLSEEALEGRRRRGGGKNKGGGGYGPLLAALAIKGSFLGLAYKGIAIMSGTAILIGKMALLLSAILGLKKLIAGNQEKTTFEIIKSPKYSEDHVHSTTFEDDHHDHFRRNYLDPGETHKRIYRFRIPEH
ncbi:uncharacterized protein [Euwallacea similis]|uniref:uncharacterized protein n=1 Tax=Euwallacea similis TaxID=1736056 RepID=UPI00344F8580